MPSSLFNCVKSDDVAVVGRTASAYKKMVKAVVPSACTAGMLLREKMQKLGQGEHSISDYQDVVRGLRVWNEQDNVYVGIPPGNRLLPRAEAMDRTYALNEVAFDLAEQSGDIKDKFLAELAAEGSV
jgi:hypothetical protein